MINKTQIQTIVREFLLAIGEDPNREGLVDTPKRVADMCDELLNPDRAKASYTSFESNNYGGIVMVKDIEFSSICEHHLLPFIGVAHVAYIPSDRIIGISKLARIIDKHAKKLQLQERLAKDILTDINNEVNPKGIAILIKAKHLCMNIRGISKRDAETITTLFSGTFEDSNMQTLFMDMIR